MRGVVCLVLLLLLSLASCRGRAAQPIATDPFLSGRATIPPPATGTVAPLGTIQPFDPAAPTVTPALPAGTILPGGGASSVPQSQLPAPGRSTASTDILNLPPVRR